MKILWISPFLLHPTEKGGQIRSLGILRELHRRHEIHFASFQLPGQRPDRLPEYCARSYLVPHILPSRRSPAFVPRFLANTLSPLPLSVALDRSAPMRRLLTTLLADRSFDVAVCDFLSTAVNLPDPSRVVLFQHNVETMIWRRLAGTSASPLKRWYFHRQAERMFQYERRLCRAARRVIAVSEDDARRIREMFGADRVAATPTGVDLEYFAPPDPSAQAGPSRDLIFAGTMDWIPNIDGILWFVREVLPLIRQRRPDVTLTIAGRAPVAEIAALGSPAIAVTGRVPDIRPYLWDARVSIVPLLAGGGTRLKIYEAMAAGVPVVSTTIGAEGLVFDDGVHLRLADRPEDFAARCLHLLENDAARDAQRQAALRLARERFSWERVARDFEAALIA